MIKFKELDIGDIFKTESEDYYIKIHPINEFNVIFLTGKDVEYNHFNDDVDVIKF